MDGEFSPPSLRNGLRKSYKRALCCFLHPVQSNNKSFFGNGSASSSSCSQFLTPFLALPSSTFSPSLGTHVARELDQADQGRDINFRPRAGLESSHGNPFCLGHSHQICLHFIEGMLLIYLFTLSTTTLLLSLLFVHYSKAILKRLLRPAGRHLWPRYSKCWCRIDNRGKLAGKPLPKGAHSHLFFPRTLLFCCTPRSAPPSSCCRRRPTFGVQSSIVLPKLGRTTAIYCRLQLHLCVVVTSTPAFIGRATLMLPICFLVRVFHPSCTFARPYIHFSGNKRSIFFKYYCTSYRLAQK